MQSGTDKKSFIQQTILSQKVLPLFYTDEEETSACILNALYEGGIRTVEYTNRGNRALHNFKALKHICEAELKDMHLGIGTIKTRDEAMAFADAGADYIISPGMAKEVSDFTAKNAMLYIPGCMTPTELMQAEATGATLVKVFPGNVLGTGFVGSVRELFPRLQFIITGGVEPDEANLTGWFAAGASAVGMGSKLITKDILQTKNYAKLTSLTQKVLHMVQSIR